MRGTILNTATVACGATLGLIVGNHLPTETRSVALYGLGLVTLGTGVKMFLESRNLAIVAGSVATAGVIGVLLHFQPGIEFIGKYGKGIFGGGSTFTSGLVASFVLFCVGPLTLLGCLQDGIEGKIELLALKSTLDGIAGFFLAAATGAGVLVTAILLFVFQGSITIMARPMKRLADNKQALGEASGAGGAILIATGIGLLEIKDLHPINYMLAVFIAPAVVILSQHLFKSRKELLG